MKKLTLFLLSALCLTAQAKIHLPEILSDNMVLQQQTSVNLWGTTDTKNTITITPSWSNGKTFEAKADKQGKWLVSIPTPMASFTPQTITISDGESITLSNILIGEVWFCSGQSNMEMPLNGFWNCPINGSNEEIALAGDWADKIHVVTIPKTGATEPKEEVPGKWYVPSPQTAPNISCSAWYFAQMLTRVLRMPVGIIVCAWGGSSVEGWTPREILNTYSDVKLADELKRGWNGQWWEYFTPLIMYNGMLHPLRNYTIKGFIWYQGEANVGKDKDHATRLNTMVNVWRKEFSETQANPLNDQLPFYLAEIAPWAGYGGAEGTSGALLREAQHTAANEVIKNAGCICTNDLVTPYEADQIHPAEKRQVGYRFAYLALNRTYGIKSIACDAPEYDHHTIDGNKLEVFFKHAEDGLSPWNDATGFEIAGADGKFYPAKAKLVESNKSFILTSDAVPAPKQVRYCFKNFQIGNVINHRNLPLVPFRSDK